MFDVPGVFELDRRVLDAQLPRRLLRRPENSALLCRHTLLIDDGVGVSIVKKNHGGQNPTKMPQEI